MHLLRKHRRIIWIVIMCLMLPVVGAATPLQDFVRESKSESFYKQLQEQEPDGPMFHVEPKLWFAAVFGYKDLIVNELNTRDVGADERARALVGAAHMGNIEIVRILIESDTSPNAITPGGSTPLMEAAQTNQIDVIGLLLEQGADPNYRNDDGFDAVIMATMEGNTEAICVLLNNGFDLSRSETRTGVTPKQLARGLGFNEVEKALSGSEMECKGVGVLEK
jgi:hypothetical protein